MKTIDEIVKYVSSKIGPFKLLENMRTYIRDNKLATEITSLTTSTESGITEWHTVKIWNSKSPCFLVSGEDFELDKAFVRAFHDWLKQEEHRQLDESELPGIKSVRVEVALLASGRYALQVWKRGSEEPGITVQTKARPYNEAVLAFEDARKELWDAFHSSDWNL